MKYLDEDNIITTELDGTPNNASFHREFKSIMGLLPKGVENFNVWFGGGCYVRKLLGKKITDIDFFSNSRDDLTTFVRFLRENGFKLYFSNRNVIKGYIDTNKERINVDVIKILFEGEIDTVRKFDFSVCKIITNPSTEKTF